MSSSFLNSFASSLDSVQLGDEDANAHAECNSINAFAVEAVSADADGARRGRPRKETYEVDRLSSLHQSIKRQLFLGRTNKQIAESLNCTPQTVTLVRNNPVIQDQLKVMNGAADYECMELMKEIEMLQPVALKLLKQTLEKGSLPAVQLEEGEDKVNPTVRIAQANSLIDRYLGKPMQRAEIKTANIHFTSDEVRALRERARSFAIDQ